MLPDKIGGKPSGKPGFSLTVISAGKPKGLPEKIGGNPGMRDNTDEEPIPSEQALDDAAREIIASVTSMKPNPSRLKDALRAFVHACNDDEYEGEGNDTEEEGN